VGDRGLATSSTNDGNAIDSVLRTAGVTTFCAPAQRDPATLNENATAAIQSELRAAAADRRNIEAELFGGLLDPSDVIVHGPKSVFKAAIMNSI